MKTKFCAGAAGAAAAMTFLAGCMMGGPNGRQTHHANSLYAYLYGDQTGHIDTATIPTLNLPLRVGIAFVPKATPKGRFAWASDDLAFTENQKMDLMKQVADQFKACPFVKSFELIPSSYLVPGGGFANLNQLRSIYDLDAIALLSYDQAQFTGESAFSFAYWTIVGLYVVPAEKNSTQTMLDAAVYDIPSRKLLFRAPGLSQIKGVATPVDLSEQLRHDSAEGFNEAATNMVAELKVQLDSFRERVKNSPKEFNVVRRPGYTGVAAFGGSETVLISAFAAVGATLRFRRRP